MGIVNMMQTINKVHTKDIAIVRVGKFCQAYGNDAFILNYLFDYKMQSIEHVYFCGFPCQTENKVRAKLEQSKINYLFLDRRNNYEVEEGANFKNLNQYEEVLEKAKRYKAEKNRIENIYQYLTGNIGEKENLEKIRKIEEIIDERRKI